MKQRQDLYDEYSELLCDLKNNGDATDYARAAETIKALIVELWEQESWQPRTTPVYSQ